MCWYEPSEPNKKFIKLHCQILVNKIKELESDGDPIGVSLKDVQILLEHLYSGECKEKELNEKQEI